MGANEISEVMRAKEEAAQKQQYFEWMMEAYPGNIYISDIDTYELLYVNEESCKTLNTQTEKLVGRKCYEVIQGRTSPCPFCTNDIITREEFYEWEFYNKSLDKTFLIKNRLISWRGKRARLELSYDMASVEYKLEKKDREREAVIRTIPGGFARVDARDMNTILWYGAEFLDIIEYTEEQFKEIGRLSQNYIHPDDMEQVLEVMRQARETDQNAVFETRVITYSGKVKYLTTTMCYVSGKDSWDGIPSFYSMGIDITEDRIEQERQRKALEDAYASARVANAAKTDFLSSMSHDIRTPMNAIMGMAAIAHANLHDKDRVRDCLSKINTSSQHLLSLINEVLDMSKIESGKIDLMPEEVNLPDLVQNVADMCKPLVSQKGLELQMTVGQVRHEKIIADGDRLQQVFMNLLSNAIKYTHNGGKIKVLINEGSLINEKKGQYEFVFSDNGIGMSKEYMPHIFEPFSRAEDSRISKIQGTGLGLAITENIVRMMNGSIEVQSRMGVGSQFTVSIPFEVVHEETSGTAELKGLPVLVVDDDQMVCENATALLNELGMRGFWVLSGEEAVRSAVKAHEQGEDFFAVILDWKMPGMDGLETLKAIRKQVAEDVPIIIISAYDYSQVEEEFLAAGANAFITKPLFKSKMLHILQVFCSTSKLDDDNANEEKIPPLLGKRILLAEDNELNREIATELLQMHGVLIDSAENGREAVEAFAASEKGYYDAILMDIQMPIMNGYEATTRIRAMGRSDAGTIPILALTANAFTADVGKAHSVGMNDHIAKPIDVNRLIEAIGKWVN